MARGRKELKISADLDRIIKEAEVTRQQALTEFTSALGEEIVRKTPVKTGRLRASWFFSPTFSPTAKSVTGLEVGDTAATGALVLARVEESVRRTIGDGDGRLYFLNGANYAIYVEARRGFVKKVVGRSRAIATQAIRNIQAIRGR